ncbi:hypothetical protein [Kutzneria sp. CA-103260]|uniref:hypothetical protein n=1 Tax=Kutzneria sp. CA-103260 TaxID=2802641 RepID=UPI001BAC57B5|nr:hypothetical protein [Kutzneria sp. CA-103260]QUQ63882.1 hypothetical protein JJ691_15990 [Kutzneria sp. CA-103260]
MDHPFALRAPWYYRERHHLSLSDCRALRPVIQKYDRHDFVRQLLADPSAYLKWDKEDKWSYPAPLGLPGAGRAIRHRMLCTELRKLYQPSHDRFYAVGIEVFCDEAGLPRAGSHRDIEVGMVMRRIVTNVAGDRRPIRRLARDLMLRMAAEQAPGEVVGESAMDIRTLWWADEAQRQQFAEDHAADLAQVESTCVEQAWIDGHWQNVTADEHPAGECTIPMWRLPPSGSRCAAGQTRSLWYGTLPTSSPVHGLDGLPKLDDQSSYRIVCFVRQHRGSCPPLVYWSRPTVPFRLASFYDPQGTKNHTVSITMPDLRALEAQATSGIQPSGVRITSPAGSGMSFYSDLSNLKAGKGTLNQFATTCTFAIELFMIVAMFVFNLFLPIVVLMFQLWWMLALRFCTPLPTGSFDALRTYFADTAHDLNTLATPLPTTTPEEKAKEAARQAASDGLDTIMGLGPSIAHELQQAPTLQQNPRAVADFAGYADPQPKTPPAPPVPEPYVPDPLCPGP